MTMQMAGMPMRDRNKKPLMKPEDSSIKKAMKAVMKLGRANRPAMPTVMKKAEGM